MKTTENERYNLESLRKMNQLYDWEHAVTSYDVDKANSYVSLIESTRSETNPKAGDRIRLTTRHGDYYPFAHIENLYDEGFSVCEQPYVPFTHQSNKGLSFNTSGGAWTVIKPEELKYVGKEMKTFCDWGHCGACGNGAIDFNAEVSVWEYKEPDPLYGDFTTKDWRRIHVSKPKEDYPNKYRYGYMYFGDGIAWKDTLEFDRFIKKYRGTLFPGHWPNTWVLWCYKEKHVRVTREEWDAFELPTDTIYLNGKRPVKFKYDEETHTVIEYYYDYEYYLMP